MPYFFTKHLDADQEDANKITAQIHILIFFSNNFDREMD